MEEHEEAHLAGEEPRVLFVEDVEGGGGVGRGVYYTCRKYNRMTFPTWSRRSLRLKVRKLRVKAPQRN